MNNELKRLCIGQNDVVPMVEVKPYKEDAIVQVKVGRRYVPLDSILGYKSNGIVCNTCDINVVMDLLERDLSIGLLDNAISYVALEHSFKLRLKKARLEL